MQAELYDKSWAAFNVFVASLAECNVAIVCACAPSLKSLSCRFFKDISDKYSSKFSSPSSSNNQYSDASSRPDNTLNSLVRTDKKRVKNGAEKHRSLKGEKDENSFKKAHEYGLDSLESVAQGYGDDLILPPLRTGSPMTSKLFEENVQSSKPIPAQNLAGAFIVSPSPTQSSDDEASLVVKRPDSYEEGLPYALTNREQRPSIDSQVSSPGLQTSADLRRTQPSPYSETSSISPDEAAQPRSFGLSDGERPRVRKKLSKEKWRQSPQEQTTRNHAIMRGIYETTN